MLKSQISFNLSKKFFPARISRVCHELIKGHAGVLLSAPPQEICQQSACDPDLATAATTQLQRQPSATLPSARVSNLVSSSFNGARELLPAFAALLALCALLLAAGHASQSDLRRLHNTVNSTHAAQVSELRALVKHQASQLASVNADIAATAAVARDAAFLAKQAVAKEPPSLSKSAAQPAPQQLESLLEQMDDMRSSISELRVRVDQLLTPPAAAADEQGPRLLAVPAELTRHGPTALDGTPTRRLHRLLHAVLRHTLRPPVLPSGRNWVAAPMASTGVTCTTNERGGVACNSSASTGTHQAQTATTLSCALPLVVVWDGHVNSDNKAKAKLPQTQALGKETDNRTLNPNGRGSHGTANATFTLAFPSKLVAIRVEVPTGVLAPSVTAIAAAKRTQVSTSQKIHRGSWTGPSAVHIWLHPAGSGEGEPPRAAVDAGRHELAGGAGGVQDIQLPPAASAIATQAVEVSFYAGASLAASGHSEQAVLCAPRVAFLALHSDLAGA
jgi:hypothetical protein